MSGTHGVRTRSRRRSRRTLLVAALVAAALGVLHGSGSAAAAIGCGTRWANAVDGRWDIAANWTAGVPRAGDIACIDVPGTYTVTLWHAQDVGELRVGSASGSGTQTLEVQGSCLYWESHGTLNVATLLLIEKTGALELTNLEACQENNAIVDAARVTNLGSIVSDPNGGGGRAIRGDLTNLGTVTVKHNLYFDGSSAAWLNQGNVTLAGGDVVLPSGQTFTNDAGGSVVEQAAGDELAVLGGTLVHGDGTFTLVDPIRLVGSDLTINGKTAASYAWNWRGTLAGNVATGQSIAVVATCGAGAQVDAGSFTNEGRIELTSAGCGAAATLDVGTGTLTNAGAGWIVASQGAGGARTLRGNLTNTGRVTASRDLTYEGSGATWHNTGALELDPGVRLVLPGQQTFSHEEGGSITGQGSVHVSGGTFVHDGGSFGIAAPIALDNSDLSITGRGTDAVGFSVAATTHFTGDLHQNQSIVLAGCAQAARIESAGFTNDGTIELTTGAQCPADATIDVGAGTLANNGRITVSGGAGGLRRLVGGFTNAGQLIVRGQCDGAAELHTGPFTNTGLVMLTSNDCTNDAVLAVDSGTLTNNGTIEVLLGAGGRRFLRGNLTNTNTVEVAHDLTYDGAGASWLNQGSLRISNGATLSAAFTQAAQSFTNGTGGSIVQTGAGRLRVSGGTFVHGDGTVSGSLGLSGANLTITGTTPATYVWSRLGSLSGNVQAGQTIRLVGDCNGPARLTSLGFYNYGWIELTSSGCSADATVDAGAIGGGMTNRGRLTTALGAGGARTVVGSLVNGSASYQPVVELQSGTTLQVGSYTQTAQGTLITLVDGLVMVSSIASSGAATLAGTLSISRLAGFNPQTGTTVPIVSGSSRTGTWTRLTGAVIAGSARYFLPKYSGTDASLDVRHAQIALAPSSGSPGTSVTVTGTGFPPSSTVSLNLRGLATVGRITTDAVGGFTRTFTVAATATPGNYKLTATNGFTGVAASANFTVT